MYLKIATLVKLTVTHVVVGVLGFAVGIYSLPILIAPEPPDSAQLQVASANSLYQTAFTKDLTDSDFLHWGEGKVSVGPDFITFNGELSPGPDFKLYLSPTFIDTELAFKANKSNLVQVGDIPTFTNFIVEVDSSVNIDDYTTVIVWCESFEQFITAAQYK